MDRRTQPRMLCADLVQLLWRDQTGRTRRVTANLEDISQSGACLQLEDAVAVGTPVKISHPKGDFTGVVKYCVFRDIGYFLGIQFAAGTQWSRRDFRPMHLLDPRRMVQRAVSRLASGRAA